MMNTFHLKILFHTHIFIYRNVKLTLIIIQIYNNFNKFLL